MQNRFIVPQFIDAEDKIWGPVTVRQFIIVLAGGLIIVLSYKFADFSLFLTIAGLISALVALFAFVKINGVNFHLFLLNVIQTIKRPKIRIWRKEYIKVEEFKIKGEDVVVENKVINKNLLPNKKLSELSLIIDTGGVYKGELEANIINNSAVNKK